MNTYKKMINNSLYDLYPETIQIYPETIQIYKLQSDFDTFIREYITSEIRYVIINRCLNLINILFGYDHSNNMTLVGGYNNYLFVHAYVNNIEYTSTHYDIVAGCISIIEDICKKLKTNPNDIFLKYKLSMMTNYELMIVK